METKTVVLDNPEKAKEFDAIFGFRGTVVVSPTKYYDALGVPEDMRTKFRIKPYGPFEIEQIKLINKSALHAFEQKLIGLGYDHESIVREYGSLEEEIKTLKGIEEGQSPEEIKGKLKRIAELQQVQAEAWAYGQSQRDKYKLFELVISHTESVENHIYLEDGEYKSYTGDFGAEQLSWLAPDIAMWLEKEIQRNSKLSNEEIAGL